MHNTQFLTRQTERFLAGFHEDHDILLIGIETDEKDTVETSNSWNGHSVGYSTTTINVVTFTATGFVWAHPSGARISGQFTQPLRACEFVLDAQGEEIDQSSFEPALGAAIVAKCGPISGFADSLLN